MLLVVVVVFAYGCCDGLAVVHTLRAGDLVCMLCMVAEPVPLQAQSRGPVLLGVAQRLWTSCWLASAFKNSLYLH